MTATNDYIAFINTKSDCEVATTLYTDAVAFRFSAESVEKLCPVGHLGPKRWLDPAIDGLHYRDISKLTDKYIAHVSAFHGYQQIASPAFQSSPEKNVVSQFVSDALDKCMTHSPDWVSIPQLPLVNDSSRNKLNKLLAESTKKWKLKTGFNGKLILPAIFTHQNQINMKADRKKKLDVLAACYNAANADGIWTVDASLSDQDGTGTFEKRFQKLRDLHIDLGKILPSDSITIGGPYWGMNIVLWSQGQIRYPAIGVGSSYKYIIPGMPFKQAKVRIALTPLRRWAITSPQLRQWLHDAIQRLGTDEQNAAEFIAIEKPFNHLQTPKAAKTQVAGFYKKWFQKFSVLPPSGRALALYHDLSSSYVLAKGLPDLPDEEGTARRPERVQQQLMMSCL